MSLNPVQFGAQVVDQFGRYLMTTFPIADEHMAQQVKRHLTHGVGGERYLSKGPYVYLNQPFEQGPTLEELRRELNLHPVVKKVFPFEYLHKHQELAVRSIVAGKHTIMATGTGSGKTEGFLLPIVDYCAKMRDQTQSDEEPRGVVAVLVYPMNALVNDQLKRFRRLLAGTGITFGRYTGETPPTSSGIHQLGSSRAYTQKEIEDLEKNPENVPLPWEECVSEEDIRKRKPMILLTNYKQLEYLLLRDKDLDLFRGAPLKYLVFDEVHTYTGILGSEVACLIRRLKNISGKRPEEIICIGTSATVAPEGGSSLKPEEITRNFGSRLFGVPPEDIEIITEMFKRPGAPPAQMYTPPPPENPIDLMNQILDAAREVHLQEEATEISDYLLRLAEKLCSKRVEEGSTNSEKLYFLLNKNRLVYSLGKIFIRPLLFKDALPRIKALGGRQNRNNEELSAEIIAYLTLGAIAQRDGEPLLRPKLHYFIQGLQGLWAVYDDDQKWKIYFDHEKGQSKSLYKLLPLKLCRSCGQHYFKVITTVEEFAADNGGKAVGYRPVHVEDDDYLLGPDEIELYLTDRLISQEEEEVSKGKIYYMCKFCGTLHSEEQDICLNESCGRKSNGMLKMMAWAAPMNSCRACGAVRRGDSEVIRTTKSGEVSDITILAQSMLSAMPEKSLQKLLIFADNRQDAAYQAGWMEERSKRFRLRHLLYRILEEDPERIWRFDKLALRLLEEAQLEGVLKRRAFQNMDDPEPLKIRWFLLEEFATSQQRRSSIENLGLARVYYEGLDEKIDPEFFNQWAETFGIESKDVVNLIRIILDYYRRRGALSEPLLQREWYYTDYEVRHGFISPPEHLRPKVLQLKSNPDKKIKNNIYGLIAPNGRSAAQLIVLKGIKRGDDDRDRFLEELWAWLKEHRFLVPAKIRYKRHGRLWVKKIPGETLQINVEKFGVKEVSDRIFCSSCRRSQSVPLATNACPEYGCNGKTKVLPRDEEHYDVYQYTKYKFVPLKAYEHSAQVSKEKREEIEKEFKRVDGKYNCLVSTPTLELGVDIGKLEMVLMRNVPPTPANYAQRAGRAGRRHRIAVVFTYCRNTQHDRYFFRNPPAMISGEIRIPSFSMQNLPLLRKHVHSATLTALRELATEEEKEIINETFPPYIWAYFGEKVRTDRGEDFKYFPEPPKFTKFKELIEKYKQEISKRLIETFHDNWPEEDAFLVEESSLISLLEAMSNQLEYHTKRLHYNITTYRNILLKFNQKEIQGFSLTEKEDYDRRRFKNALDTYRKEDRNNYTLNFLSDDGFFPGYALNKEPCRAQCFEPFQELSRPPPVALREFTPANFLYANKNIFKVERLDFYKFRHGGGIESREQLTQKLFYEPDSGRVTDNIARVTEGGEKNLIPIESFELKDIELRHVRGIDDSSDTRRRVAFEIHGMLLNQHSGGEIGSINQLSYRYLKKELIRLVNLGPKSRIKANKGLGFPICPKCGEVRSPFASPAEIDNFNEHHKRICKVDGISWAALHVEHNSDTLSIGPYPEKIDAVNVMEAIQIGAKNILDMTNMDLEGFAAIDDYDNYWAVLFDPLPGGSGFLPQLLQYWNPIIEASIGALERCTCNKACYSCLLHFRNQQYHDILDRNKSIELLMELIGEVEFKSEIPPVPLQKSPQIEGADSDAEENLLSILESRKFPLPTEDHVFIDLGNKSGIEADYAYMDKKIIIFIDGLSPRLHGNPVVRKRDKINRAKAEMQGYKVLEISAQGLKDSAILNSFLNRLAVYLEREDLID